MSATNLVPMISTLPWKLKIHICLLYKKANTALWFCRAVMLPLFLSWSIVSEGICPVSWRHLVEYDNIHASHLDGPGRCRHPKFEVVSQQTQHICMTFIQHRPNVFDVGSTLYKVIQIERGRRFSRHQRSQILTRIIHGVALYAGIYGKSVCPILLSPVFSILQEVKHEMLT